jgi:hypothetical protein
MTDKPGVWLFAGPGDSTQANTDALLGQFVPQEIDYIVIPEKIARSQKGLMTVWNWLAQEFDESSIDRVPDIGAALREAAAASGATLVLLWGEDGNQECRDLLALATELSVPVKDLTDGMDDLEFASDEPGPPAPDPEPEVPARRAGRGTRRSAAAEPAAPAEAVSAPDPKPEVPARRGRPRNVLPPADELVESGSVSDEAISAQVDKDIAADESFVSVLGDGFPHTIEELAAFVDARLSIHLYNLAKTLGEPPAPVSAGRPRKDGSPAQPNEHKDEKPFYTDGAGRYQRRGRGKAPGWAESEVVWLTADQAETLGLEFG